MRRMIDPNYAEDDEDDVRSRLGLNLNRVNRDSNQVNWRNGGSIEDMIDDRIYGHAAPAIREMIRRAASQPYVQRTVQNLVKAPPLDKFLAFLMTLNRMADLYLAKGDLAAAGEALTEGTKLLDRLKMSDAKVPAVRLLWFNQGRLSALKGDIKDARALFAKALGRTGDAPSRSGVVSQARKGDAKKAGELPARSPLDRGDQRGPLANLVSRTEAVLDLEEGNTGAATARLRALLERDLRDAELILPGLSEAEALGFVEANLRDRDVLLQALRLDPGTPALEAYQWVWRTRALATRAIAEQRRFAVGTGAAAPQMKKLREVAQELSLLALAPAPENSSQRADRAKRLGQLNEAKEALEKELARVSRTFRSEQDLQSSRIADLVASLPAGTAVVDFVQTWVDRPRDLLAGAAKSTRHYDAFIVRGDRGKAGSSVAWVRLGPAAPIDRAIANWRAAIAARAGAVTGGEGPDHRLRRLVWDPLERHLDGYRTVIIIPDQALTRVAWPALPGREPGTFLLDQYAIATAPHGQALIEVLGRDPGRRAAGEPQLLLLGGADYDRSAAPPQDRTLHAGDTTRGPSRPPEAGTRGGWRPLAGTLAEINILKALWGRSGPVAILTGSDATEARLRTAMPRSCFIHLATHGFFADAAFRSALQNDLTSERLFGPLGEAAAGAAAWGRATVASRNPLILSGVVLSGANGPLKTDDRGLPTGDDAILTAEEVAYLDLADTEFVVLSACQTGLGDVAGGEGVFGLQSAFHRAGARTSIASLWQVEDRATQALMVELYRNLWERKLPKIEALRRAQLTMIDGYDPAQGHLGRGREVERPGRQAGAPPKPDSSTPPAPSSQRLHPYYWAGFNLNGDWR
jgi:CHAT domain-containing protein/tetratricopeptide (TPR) repeat protein